MDVNRDDKGKFVAGNSIGPRWDKGQSGNPTGKSSAGIAISCNLNAMAEMTEAQVIAIRDDESVSLARRCAARILLCALENTPDGDKCFDRICDRTHGRPKQQTEITGAGGGPLQIAGVDLAQIITNDDLEQFTKLFFIRR